MIGLNLILIALLIGLTGFFVATEFAIVKVRTSRIDQLIEEGKKGAVSAKKVIEHLDEYLSACQLGITVTALGLGWLGEPTVEKLLHPLFDKMTLSDSVTSILSFGIAFGFVTFLHVVVGELAPKTVAIQKAEFVTLLFSRPLIIFYKIMFPFIWVLNGSARVVVGIFGIKSASEHELAHSEEELRLLLTESYKSGEINQTELKYVNNIFEFDNRIAKEIMVPRTEISSISVENTIDEVFSLIKDESYTRYPVTLDGDKDNILGIVNMKELLTAKIISDSNNEKIDIKNFINPVISVIDSVPINDLLVKMQRERVHMAILIDEYGGTSGLVTVEDILEEIVGEIRDEFDDDEVPEIRKLGEDRYLVDAKVLISEINDLLKINLDDENVDTIGGWMLTKHFEANMDTVFEEEGYIFKVNEIDGNHILYVEILKQVEQIEQVEQVQ